jgi:hypothetical protein
MRRRFALIALLRFILGTMFGPVAIPFPVGLPRPLSRIRVQGIHWGRRFIQVTTFLDTRLATEGSQSCRSNRSGRSMPRAKGG